jgi:hypothetical protein
MRICASAAVAALVALVVPAPTAATWSAPVRIAAVEAGSSAVAVNAGGDAVVAVQ